MARQKREKNQHKNKYKPGVPGHRERTRATRQRREQNSATRGW